ncbi:MAG: universal stress protein [Rubrivivax sp.]|nr:universal stress protein [Rubrivivax sp.]
MPITFTRPLLATEHGEFDTGAEAVAFALARRCGLPLAGVLPVLGNPEFEAVAPQLAARADAEASVKREHLVAQAQAAGVALELCVRHGPEPYAEIVEEARGRASDLIVIRRRGRRGLLANLLIGEMVSKVVAHAPCSVLVALRGAQMWSRGVLVGLDPQAPDMALLDEAAAIAVESALPLRLVCVAANRDAQAAAQQVLDRALLQARRHGGQALGELRIGRAHEELVAAAQACGADLLVVARHGAGPLGRVWIGGTAQKVTGLAHCPVLIHVNHPPRETATI